MISPFVNHHAKHPTIQTTQWGKLGKPLQVLSADLVVDAGVTAEAGEVPGNPMGNIQLEIHGLQLMVDDG